MAHIAGLVAAGVHPSPFPHADIVTTTTHKTLRGGRGGLIFSRPSCPTPWTRPTSRPSSRPSPRQIDKAVFPGVQGGPLMHVIAGKAVGLLLAAGEDFRRDQRRTVENAALLAAELAARGARVVSGGTDNHLMLVDVTPLGVTGKEAEHLLDEIGITVNKNAIPFDPLPPNTSSGIRIGTPATTTRGFGPDEMRAIARLITDAIAHRDDPAAQADLAAEVAGITEPLPGPGPRRRGGVSFVTEAGRDPAPAHRGLPRRRGDLVRGHTLPPAARQAARDRRPAQQATRQQEARARGGGVAVVLAFLIVGGGLVVFNDAIGMMPSGVRSRPASCWPCSSAAPWRPLIGAIDDLFDLRARWQLLGQLVLAGVAVGFGIAVESIGNPFGSGIIPFGPPFAIAFTVVWVVGMINSINFIDGLDGLSTGIVLIAALTLGVLSLTTDVAEPFVAVLCIVLAGALLGFLRYNFQPASIFPGTAGVMFMGYTLAILSILGEAKVVVALLVLGVPIIDTFWVIVRRLLAVRSPFTPDRGHIHHRLLDLGLGHRGTVLLIYAICASLGLMSLLVSTATQVYAFLGALVGFGVVLFLVTREPHEALEPEAYETGREA